MINFRFGITREESKEIRINHVLRICFISFPTHTALAAMILWLTSDLALEQEGGVKIMVLNVLPSPPSHASLLNNSQTDDYIPIMPPFSYYIPSRLSCFSVIRSPILPPPNSFTFPNWTHSLDK